jgi:hypothetical protein
MRKGLGGFELLKPSCKGECRPEGPISGGRGHFDDVELSYRALAGQERSPQQEARWLDSAATHLAGAITETAEVIEK